MKLWKHYKVQFLLMTLAALQLFAYFYPGYAKGSSFVLLQTLLVMIIIWMLYASRKQYTHHKLQ